MSWRHKSVQNWTSGHVEGRYDCPKSFGRSNVWMKMVYIPAGTFTMGALEDDRDAYSGKASSPYSSR